MQSVAVSSTSVPVMIISLRESGLAVPLLLRIVIVGEACPGIGEAAGRTAGCCVREAALLT